MAQYITGTSSKNDKRVDVVEQIVAALVMFAESITELNTAEVSNVDEYSDVPVVPKVSVVNEVPVVSGIIFLLKIE